MYGLCRRRRAWAYVLITALTVGSGCAGQGEGRRRAMRPTRRRPDRAPALGAEAPGFKLKTYAGDGEVELAAFRGKRPVVLVFGSYT